MIEYLQESDDQAARMEFGGVTLADLEAMPTLHQGQYDNLKIERDDTRVWLSRLGVEDGMPFDNAVTVERLVDGRWLEVAVWAAS